MKAVAAALNIARFCCASLADSPRAVTHSTRPPVTTVHKGRVHLDPSLKGQDRAATRVEGGIILQNARSRFDRVECGATGCQHGRPCGKRSLQTCNQSGFLHVIEHAGAEKAEAWAKGVVANLARPPKGGDTDQVKAVAAGECAVALSNSYYLARMIKSDKAEDKAVMSKVKVMFPNQATSGTHVNIAGAGVAWMLMPMSAPYDTLRAHAGKAGWQVRSLRHGNV